MVVAWIVMCSGLLCRAATPEEVQNAVDKAERYLYSQQKRGNWEGAKRNNKIVSPAQDQPGGLSATAVFALLSAGENPSNPKLASAIRFLESTEVTGVYTLGMRCQVWHMLPPDDTVKSAIHRDGDLLMKAISPDTGMYDATINPTGQTPDLSVSQYGVQGVWACAREGMEVSADYWTSVDKGWRAAQRKDGSWNYSKPPADSRQTWPMTAAAVATLFMSQSELSMGTSPSCNGNIVDPQAEKGLVWLGNHFEDVFRSSYRYYALYGLEEIGAASGRKYFGSTDWYAQGADYLMRAQKANGSWDSDVANTSFAILFLARGRAPVGMNKLEYYASPETPDKQGDWNQRPRDVANFDVWISRQVELDRLLNWQVVNLNAPPAELHDASILFIAGDKALNFSEEHKLKLKTFIQQGGMIVFNSDCGSGEFSDSVKQLAGELFPQIGEFRELPPDHCILKNEQFLGSDWHEEPTVLGLSNGVRELMILLPKADPSRAWQAQLTSSRSEMFELGADLLLYASDKQNIREKGDSYFVEPSSRVIATRTLKIARIQFDGMWDPEPGGWPRLAAIMHNRDQADLAIDPVTLGPNTNLDAFKVADLTGTGHFRINAADWIQLKQFVENGGTLIVDAAGGSSEFADDAHAQLAEAFPDNADQLDEPLRPLHVLYTQVGSKIDEVGYRAFARRVLGEDLKIPRIRGIKINGRIAVFFSAEDLSAGLVGEPVDGIVGYDPDSAALLMEHMILYAETGGHPSSTVEVTTEPAGN
jgi:hypothetical protein